MIYIKNRKLIILTALLILAFSSPAYAYLDPGTGSVMVQGLLAGVASALAVIKLYWRRLKHFFFRLIGKKIIVQEENENRNNEQQ